MKEVGEHTIFQLLIVDTTSKARRVAIWSRLRWNLPIAVSPSPDVHLPYRAACRNRWQHVLCKQRRRECHTSD